MSAKSTPMTAVDDGEVVVFLIGMTFNKPWAVRQWWPVFTAMPKMLRELRADGALGLLEARTLIGAKGPTVVQYWRSPEHLEQWARAKDKGHMPAWAAFYKSPAATSGAVGIWHETFVTQPGKRESLYVHVAPMGFAKAASEYRPVIPGEETAKKRRAGKAVAT